LRTNRDSAILNDLTIPPSAREDLKVTKLIRCKVDDRSYFRQFFRFPERAQRTISSHLKSGNLSKPSIVFSNIHGTREKKALNCRRRLLLSFQVLARFQISSAQANPPKTYQLKNDRKLRQPPKKSKLTNAFGKRPQNE
jgi:hypothetical protein